MKATVIVTLKPTVLDPQGMTIQRSVQSMGLPKSRTCDRARTFDVNLADGVSPDRGKGNRPEAGEGSLDESGHRRVPHRLGAAMKFGVVIFPGSNCDHDCYYAIESVIGKPVEFIWHQDTSVKGFDAVILPGGFAYGDYLRTGALAKFSPVMQSRERVRGQGRAGFRHLQRISDSDGSGTVAWRADAQCHMKYICKFLKLSHGNDQFAIHEPAEEGTDPQHSDRSRRWELLCGCGNAEAAERQGSGCVPVSRRKSERITGEYCGHPERRRNVLGMMPHPDRSSEQILGSTDGKLIFESMVNALAGREVAWSGYPGGE